MDNSPFHLTSRRLPQRFAPSAWPAALLLALTLGLGGCDRGSDARPPSTEVEVRTPMAPDARGGGSSGFKGSVPTADTSGGPSSGSNSPGASSSDPAPASSAPASAVPMAPSR